MLNTRWQRLFTNSATNAWMPSTAYASTPWRCRASRQFLPESSDTSRSDDVPPISTATRPKSRGLVIRFGASLAASVMTHLAHDAHLGGEPHTMFMFHRLLYV